MKKVTSISGGKTSAYLAVHYPADYLVFALVRTDDKRCKFPDRVLAKKVEDRLGKPFIGTLEDDLIISTIFDLEQFLGQRIHWVSGITYDEVVASRGGWLPNKLHRYCTQFLKIEPIFYWWAELIGEPVEMQIGFRANEVKRKNKMLAKANEQGVLEYKATFEKHKTGRHKGLNKWENIAWQKPTFPLINDLIFKDKIEQYWHAKPVRFAPLNNCIGCFNRHPMLLKKMSCQHPQKFEWFIDQEGGKNGYWRSDTTYEKIKNHSLQVELNFEDFSSCDSGFCSP